MKALDVFMVTALAVYLIMCVGEVNSSIKKTNFLLLEIKKTLDGG
jgi:hypothetical protein